MFKIEKAWRHFEKFLYKILAIFRMKKKKWRFRVKNSMKNGDETSRYEILGKNPESTKLPEVRQESTVNGSEINLTVRSKNENKECVRRKKKETTRKERSMIDRARSTVLTIVERIANGCSYLVSSQNYLQYRARNSPRLFSTDHDKNENNYDSCSAASWNFF